MSYRGEEIIHKFEYETFSEFVDDIVADFDYEDADDICSEVRQTMLDGEARSFEVAEFEYVIAKFGRFVWVYWRTGDITAQARIEC